MFGSRSSLSTTLISADSRGSCSQTRTTVHPAFVNAASASRSRSTLRRSLGVQYHSFVEGILPWSGQACQKHPSTKTATLRAVKTTSGLTGRRPGTTIGKSFLKRYPRRWSKLRSSTSGFVPERLIARIFRPLPGDEAGGTDARLPCADGGGAFCSIRYPASGRQLPTRHDSPLLPSGHWLESLRREATA